MNRLVKSILVPFMALVASLMLVACQSLSGPLEPLSSPSPQSADSLPDKAMLETPAGVLESYELGSGDKLRVLVFDEEDLSGEFQVDGSGMVSMPLIGQVLAEGRTVRELEAAIADSLRGRYLRDPQVSAEVLEFRPYYILGEVNRPGTYPYTSGLTVMNAVATAEGYTYRANQRVVFIRRAGEDREKQYSLSSSTMVRPGDTVRIAERIF